MMWSPCVCVCMHAHVCVAKCSRYACDSLEYFFSLTTKAILLPQFLETAYLQLDCMSDAFPK